MCMCGFNGLYALDYAVELGANMTMPQGQSSVYVDPEGAIGFSVGGGVLDIWKIGPISTDVYLRFIQKNWSSKWSNDYVEVFPRVKYPIMKKIIPYLGVGIAYLVSSGDPYKKAIMYENANVWKSTTLGTIDLSAGLGCDYFFTDGFYAGVMGDYSITNGWECEVIDHRTLSFSNLTVGINVGYKF
jgi:opacity protein-like surface antigen